MRQLIATLALLLLIPNARADDALVGDAAAGAHFALRCIACHSVTDNSNKVGPTLIGVYDGKVAAAPGFQYSDGFRRFASDHPVWDSATLDMLLTNPKIAIPGNKMSFVGIPGAQDRANVIAYLKTLGTGPAPTVAAAAAPPPAPPPIPVANEPAGDPDHGMELAVLDHCTTCHSFTGSHNRTGPYLLGIFGSPVADAFGFNYSDALKTFARSHPVWDEATLDQFLTDPKALVPHTSMGFAGIPDAQDRADIIAYLKAL